MRTHNLRGSGKEQTGIVLDLEGYKHYSLDKERNIDV